MVKRKKSKRQVVSSHCENIWTKNWNMICTGEYPEDIKTKYGGYMMNENEVYSAFSMEKSPTIMLIVLRSEILVKCKTVELINATSLRCYEGIGQPISLSFPKSRVSCMNFSFRMADELAEYCSPKNLPSNDFTALFYTEYLETEDMGQSIQQSNNCSIFSLNIWCVLFMAICTLFCIYRFR